MNVSVFKLLLILCYLFQVEKPGYMSDRDTFNSRMSHPVGRDFIPTLAHKELTRPRIRTLAGTIIEPMGKDQIVESGKRSYIKSENRDGTKHKTFIKQYQLEAKLKPTLDDYSRQLRN